jgi:polyisoprenoid-binding protein YceI
MAASIPPGTYPVDAMHTQLGFCVTHLGISVIRGTFDRFTGALTVGSSVGDTSVALEAETASVNTGNTLRDQHIHGADFFDVANHPAMSFRSTTITESDRGYQMVGDLTLKGITAPITLDVTFNGSGVFPVDGSTHHGFSASGTLSRSAFNMGYAVPMVSDDVTLLLEAQFVAAAAAPVAAAAG